MKTRRMISVFADMAAIMLFAYLLVFPDSATAPTRSALEFCAQTLIPSLFIYMVLAKMVITLPVTAKLIQKLGLETVALIMGTLCGSPVGAKNAMTLYESGRITKKHAEFLCSYTNNASMSFVIGFVGGELLCDTGAGLRLLIYQIAASVIAAVVMKLVIFGKENIPKPICDSSPKIGLREAVADSAMTMLNLCACVVFFIVAGSAVSDILKLNVLGDAVFKSLLEFSSGCAAAMKTGSYAFPIIAFSIGQTGLSVMLQVKSVIANKLSIRPFLLGKLICCSVMTFMAIIFG